MNREVARYILVLAGVLNVGLGFIEVLASPSGRVWDVCWGVGSLVMVGAVALWIWARAAERPPVKG